MSLDIVYMCLAVTVGPSLNMAYNRLDWLSNKNPLATFPLVLGILALEYCPTLYMSAGNADAHLPMFALQALYPPAHLLSHKIKIIENLKYINFFHLLKRKGYLSPYF